MLQKVYLVLMFGFVIISLATAQKENIKQTNNKPQPKATVKFAGQVKEKEEYAVFEAIAKERFGNKNEQFVVISEKVSGCVFNIERLYIIDELEKSGFSKEILKEMNKDCDKKKGNYQLKANLFNRKIKIVLMSENQLAKFPYSNDCREGWKSFYGKYPESNGIMSLSRVGFNTEKNLAVVDFGNQRQCLDGNGQIIFLHKQNAGWKIIHTQPTWIS